MDNATQNKGAQKMTKLMNAVADLRDKWTYEALLNFMLHVQKNGKTERQEWANGVTMVGPLGAGMGAFVPLALATAEYRVKGSVL